MGRWWYTGGGEAWQVGAPDDDTMEVVVLRERSLIMVGGGGRGRGVQNGKTLCTPPRDRVTLFVPIPPFTLRGC